MPNAPTPATRPQFRLGLGQSSDSEGPGASRGGRAQGWSSRGRQLKTREELSDEEFEQSLEGYGSEVPPPWPFPIEHTNSIVCSWLFPPCMHPSNSADQVQRKSPMQLQEEVPSHLARYGQSIEKFLAWRQEKPEPTLDEGMHYHKEVLVYLSPFEALVDDPLSSEHCHHGHHSH